MGMTLRVMVPPHPLIGHWLCVLRDRHTPPPLYATATLEVGRWLTYEAIRDWIPQRTISIDGCHGKTDGSIVDPDIPILALPMLRAGLGLWDGARTVLPSARIFHVDMSCPNLPDTIEARCGVIVFAAQIASGRSLVALLNELSARQVTGDRLRVITTLASAPGLALLGEHHPSLRLYTACIDPLLTEDGAIDPGIGDVASRLFGITPQPRATIPDASVDSAGTPA